MSLLDNLIRWQETHPYRILFLFSILTMVLLPGLFQTETIVALENMMPSAAESVKTANTLRNEGFSFDSFALKISVGHSTSQNQPTTIQEISPYINNLEASLLGIHGVTNVVTPLERESLVAKNQKTAVITMQGYQGDSGKEMSRIFNEIRNEASVQKPRGVEIEIVGVPAVQQELSQIVTADTRATGLISLILVFLITLLLFNRSINAAIMPIIVVIFSVVWLYGSIGYLGIPISTLAGSVAALVIGIGVDYSIHILNAYRHFRKNLSVRRSLEKAVHETGLAIFFTSVTTISAFLSFTAGSMPEMTRFGIIMSLGIFYALVLSFVLLPALFVVEEQIMNYVVERVKQRE